MLADARHWDLYKVNAHRVPAGHVTVMAQPLVGYWTSSATDVGITKLSCSKKVSPFGVLV